jgi:hypothetical protein
LKYNLGFYKNIKEIFGENFFLWWIPYSFSKNNALKGYSFEINDHYIFKSKNESKSYYTSKNTISNDKEYDNTYEENEKTIDIDDII